MPSGNNLGADQSLIDQAFDDQLILRLSQAQFKIYIQGPTQQNRADCVYCEGKYQYVSKVTTPCGHKYHKLCLIPVAKAAKVFRSIQCVGCPDQDISRFTNDQLAEMGLIRSPLGQQGTHEVGDVEPGYHRDVAMGVQDDAVYPRIAQPIAPPALGYAVASQNHQAIQAPPLPLPDNLVAPAVAPQVQPALQGPVPPAPDNRVAPVVAPQFQPVVQGGPPPQQAAGADVDMDQNIPTGPTQPTGQGHKSESHGSESQPNFTRGSRTMTPGVGKAKLKRYHPYHRSASASENEAEAPPTPESLPGDAAMQFPRSLVKKL